MTVNENMNFICRYETVSRNQQYMQSESETYKQAEIWLILNESKYLAIVNGEAENDIGTVENDNIAYSDRLALAHCETIAKYH